MTCDVPVGRVVLEPAVRLEVEQHDRHPAASEQRDLSMAIARSIRLHAQARALGCQVEQVLAPDEALARRLAHPFLGSGLGPPVLDVHGTIVAHALLLYR